MTMRTQPWTRAAGSAAIFTVVVAVSSAVHAQPPGQAGPKSAGPQPTGPQQGGPQPTGPQPTGSQQAGPEPAGPEQTGPITPEVSQKSDDLFKRGKDYYKDGKLKEAYGSYRAAWDLKKSYDLAANLGNAELLLGLKRDAAEHYAYCLRTFAATGGKDRREAAQKKFDEARKEVGALSIKVSPGGAEVLIDGKSVGRAPLKDEVYVDPGGRIVEARLVGYEQGKQSVQVEKGGPTQTITLELLAKKVDAPQGTGGPGKVDGGSGVQVPPSLPITPPPPPPPKKKNLLLIGAGAGLTAVAAGVGVALLVLGGNEASDADALIVDLKAKGGPQACSTGNPPQDCAKLHQLNVDSDAAHNAGVGMFVGASVVGLATLTYALWPMKRAEQQKKKQKPQGVSMVPVIGGDMTGAVVRGRF